MWRARHFISHCVRSIGFVGRSKRQKQKKKDDTRPNEFSVAKLRVDPGKLLS